MSDRTHNPDKWTIIGDGKNFKVLGGWSGGYLGSDSWRLSSGLQKIEEDEDYYLMHNYSGSIYKCHKGSEGTTVLSGSIYADIKNSDDSIKSYTVEEFLDTIGDKDE